jgi:hypothetical protein
MVESNRTLAVGFQTAFLPIHVDAMTYLSMDQFEPDLGAHLEHVSKLQSSISYCRLCVLRVGIIRHS